MNDTDEAIMKFKKYLKDLDFMSCSRLHAQLSNIAGANFIDDLIEQLHKEARKLGVSPEDAVRCVRAELFGETSIH